MAGEVMILITGADALLRLTLDCKFPEARARRLLNIAWEFGQKAEPCPGGYVHIWYHGKDDTDNHVYSVVEHIGPAASKRGNTVANSEGVAYTERNSFNQAPVKQRKGKTMPPRRTRQTAPAPEPEVAEANGSASKLDNVQKYLDRDNTPTLADYAEWFGQNVVDPTQIDVDRLIGLAVTFYGEFQASDFNREQKAARKAEREQAAEPEAETEPAKPRGRGAAKPAAGKPATTKPAGRKPAGKSRATAASGAAVY
jgi:hypothetical protein